MTWNLMKDMYGNKLWGNSAIRPSNEVRSILCRPVGTRGICGILMIGLASYLGICRPVGT